MTVSREWIERPSGLVVPLSTMKPDPIPVEKILCECSVCHKPNFKNKMVLAGFSPDPPGHKWERHAWSCGHKDIRCPSCLDDPIGCSTCGCVEEKT